MRFADPILYVRSAPSPICAGYSIRVADKIALAFRPTGPVKYEQLKRALEIVVSKPGRMGEGPERDVEAWRIRVRTWVDVSDCVESESSEGVVVEPPPLYPSADEPPAYGA